MIIWYGWNTCADRGGCVNIIQSSVELWTACGHSRFTRAWWLKLVIDISVLSEFQVFPVYYLILARLWLNNYQQQTILLILQKGGMPSSFMRVPFDIVLSHPQTFFELGKPIFEQNWYDLDLCAWHMRFWELEKHYMRVSFS